MPRQNRVTPFGDIVTVAERGTMMGNRGILHDVDGRIRRSWQVKRWLICVLEFRGRHRTVMFPNRYTELFFLDEATGLAAGHRPCAECRWRRYMAFRDAWSFGEGRIVGSEPIRAEMMDAKLHVERIDPDRSKQVFKAKTGDLPDGVFVTLDALAGDAWLIWGDDLIAWSPGGYKERRPRPSGAVTVLTPRSTVAAIREGYVPEVHPSAWNS